MSAATAGHTGLGFKCYSHIKQKIDKWIGMAPYPSPITQVWTEQERDDGTLLVCFGPPGLLDQNDEEQVQRAIRQLIPGADVVFASADSAYGWRGFIDGAIQSGVEAAHAVFKRLNGERS